MKSLVMTIILSCFLGAAAAQSIVSNVRVQQSEEQLIVMYDLAVQADIEIHVSFDGGATCAYAHLHVYSKLYKLHSI